MAIIKGEWRWNDVVTCNWEPPHDWYSVSFTSNGTQFASLHRDWSVGYHYIEYWRGEPWAGNADFVLAGKSANEMDDFFAVDEAYRIMDFGEVGQEIDDGLYNFITQNAHPVTVAEKLLIAVEKIPQVYDAGKQAEYDAFWDTLQNNGKRTNYTYAFSRWTGNYFCPKYKIVPTEEGGAKNIFHYFRAAKKLEAKYIDLSQVPRGINDAKSYSYSFCSSGELEEIEDIGLYPSYSYEYAFAYNVYLKKIAMIRVDAETRLANAFKNCLALEEVYFDGEIGRSFSISDSTRLKRASIENVINHLSLSPSIARGQTLTLSKKAVDAAIDGHIWSEEHQIPIYVEGRGSETDTWQNLIAGVVDAGWAITLV